MFNKFLASLVLGFSLHTGLASAAMEAVDPANTLSSHHHESYTYGLRNYAVVSNQVAVTTGENIPWSPASGTISSGITVDGAGNITFSKVGLYLVQYTVRLQKSPFNGTSTAVVQLQQTVSGTPENITQAAITNNVSNDGLTAAQPESQTQITGFAIVNVTSSSNNVINLAVTITGSNLAIPAASGMDANAQLTILQIQ